MTGTGHERPHDGARSTDLPVVRRSSHAPVMGTDVDLAVLAGDGETAAAAETHLLEELRALESTLTVHDERSPFCCWRRGEAVGEPASAVIGEVVALAGRWEERTGGVFHTGTDVLTRCWREAERTGRAPGDADLAAARVHMAERRHLNLNAVAKGWVVDEAATRTQAAFPGVELLVNAGGDLTNRTSETVVVAVENPLTPFDNAPPAHLMGLPPGTALATSGGTRRGFTVGGTWYSHVIDPRTGRPVDHRTSATALAPTTAEADVLATVGSVMAAADAVAFVTALEPAGSYGLCILTPGGDSVVTASFRSLLLPPG